MTKPKEGTQGKDLTRDKKIIAILYIRSSQVNIKISPKILSPLVSLHKVNKFPVSLKLLKLTQRIENWNRTITIKGIEIGIKNHHTKKNTGPDAFYVKILKNK